MLRYENYLYRIQENKLQVVNELPFGYDPVNFLGADGNIYMFSEHFNSLDRFDLEGQYIETLYQFEEETKIKYLAYNESKNYFLATSPEDAKVYYISQLTA